MEIKGNRARSGRMCPTDTHCHWARNACARYADWVQRARTKRERPDPPVPHTKHKLVLISCNQNSDHHMNSNDAHTEQCQWRIEDTNDPVDVCAQAVISTRGPHLENSSPSGVEEAREPWKMVFASIGLPG